MHDRVVAGHGGSDGGRVGYICQHLGEPETGGPSLQNRHAVAPGGQSERDAPPQHPGRPGDQHPHALGSLRPADPGAGEHSSGPTGEARTVDLRGVTDVHWKGLDRQHRRQRQVCRDSYGSGEFVVC